MSDTVTLTIDDQSVETPEGANLLAAALEAGVCIPNLCCLPGTTPSGACRVCLVEVEENGRTRMTAACTLHAKAGMIIQAHSDAVLRARRNVVEMLLAEVPESEVLQRMAERLEVVEVRHPSLERDCLLCGRCVAACLEIAGTGSKGFIGKSTERHIGLPFYKEEYCQKCGECEERCPLEIDPVPKRGKPGGVCGSELTNNDFIPDICTNCVLD